MKYRLTYWMPRPQGNGSIESVVFRADTEAAAGELFERWKLSNRELMKWQHGELPTMERIES